LGTDRPLSEEIQQVTALLQSEQAQQECLPPRSSEHED
jgi:hypothetical protein